ncbi:MAG TPA: iron ABC transporter permease [Vicinamibacterales bacterium]|nr:iron ABC transporter permease [Vicinamibacterales bacterium]
MNRGRLLRIVVLFGVPALLVWLIAPTLGSVRVSILRALDTSIPFDRNVDAQILFVARLPRTVAGIVVGAALAAAGVVFQGLLRNPLATPYTLGVSAGAALGAMLAITLRWTIAAGPYSAVPLAAFAGSLAAVMVVYGLATMRARRALSTHVLLLAGVTLNSFFSALILCVQYFASFADAFRAIRWLMGDLDISSYRPIGAALPLLAVAGIAFAWLPRALNVLTFGAEAAEARGIDVTRAQRVAFFSASMATGAAVSIGGPIGFVGIIVPHLVRLLVGSDHRAVLIASVLFGGAFLVACDTIARTVLAPIELPVGVVTALIGGPFFLWLLIARR